jgi:hypothetical protein
MTVFPQDMGKHGMDCLGMLCPLLAATIDDGPDYHWDRNLPTVHVIPVGGLIDDGVHGVKHEVHPGVNHYRAHTNDSRSHCGTGYGVLGHWRVNHALWSEPFQQPLSRIANIPGAFYTLADDHDGWVRGHHLVQGFIDSQAILELSI